MVVRSTSQSGSTTPARRLVAKIDADDGPGPGLAVNPARRATCSIRATWRFLHRA